MDKSVLFCFLYTGYIRQWVYENKRNGHLGCEDDFANREFESNYPSFYQILQGGRLITCFYRAIIQITSRFIFHTSLAKRKHYWPFLLLVLQCIYTQCTYNFNHRKFIHWCIDIATLGICNRVYAIKQQLGIRKSNYFKPYSSVS